MADNSIIDTVFSDNAFAQVDEFNKKLQASIAAVEKLNNALKNKGGNDNKSQLVNQLEAEQKAIASLESQITAAQARINQQSEEKLILLERTKQAEKARRDTIRQNIAAENMQADSANGLKSRIKALADEYGRLSKAEQGGARGSELANSIKKLKKELQEANAPLRQSTSLIGRLPTYLSNLAALITNNVLGALANLGKYFIDVYKSIQVTGDGFNEMVSGLTSGWDYFTKSLASGDFSNFFTNMKRAIDAGREYSRVMDDLADRNRALKLTSADVKFENEQLKQVMDNVNLSYQERLAATDQFIANEKKLADEAKKNAGLEAAATLRNVAGKLGMAKEDQQKLLDLIKTYGDSTEELRNQASEYNKQLDAIDRLKRVGLRDYRYFDEAEKKQKELNASTTEQVKLYAQTLRAYGKSADDELDKIVATQVKVVEADSNLLEQTRRAARTRETLKKSIADQAQKTADAELASSEASISQQKALFKLQQDIARAEMILIQIKSDAQQKSLKKTMDDEKQAYESRIMAAGHYFENLKEMQLDKEAFDKEAAMRAVEQRMKEDKGITGLSDLEKKATYDRLLQAELERITQDGAAKRADIEQNYSEKITQITESNARIFVASMNKKIEAAKRLNEVSQDQSEAAILEAYKRGELSREDYEKKKAEIVKEYADKNYNVEIEAIEEAFKSTALTLEEREKLEKILHENKRRRAKETADYEYNQLRELAEKEKELRSQLGSELEGLAKSFVSGRFSAYKQNLDAEEERLKRNSDLEISLLERNKREELAKFKEQGASSEELANKRIELDGEVADQKIIIAERVKVQEVAIEERRRQMAIQEAKFNRMAAIAKIVANTAIAITGSLLNPTLLPMIISLGAVQLATVLSTPLPRYAQGTDNHKGGLAILGDGGKQELAVAPDGTTYLSSNRPELVNMPRGTIVFPDAKAMQNSILSGMKIGTISKTQPVAPTIIPNNVNVSMNFDRDGIIKIAKDGEEFVKFLNRHI